MSAAACARPTKRLMLNQLCSTAVTVIEARARERRGPKGPETKRLPRHRAKGPETTVIEARAREREEVKGCRCYQGQRAKGPRRRAKGPETTC